MSTPTRLFLLLFVFLYSCTHNTTTPVKKEASHDRVREPDDSARYTHIKYDFYKTPEGHLCERKLAFNGPRDTGYLFDAYYDSLYSIHTGDTILYQPLETIVDIDSYVEVDSSNYSKDKRHVYYFQPTSDGGVRRIVDGADPMTIKRLCEYGWGIDKQHVFYMGDSLTGINLTTLQVLYSPDTTDHFVQYVKDDKLVYYTNWIIPNADAKTFTVVSGKSWEAEDRNNTYEAASPHPKPHK